jgi:outer membrane protein OmpA-like peptidoglycan-associated protein
VFTTGEIRMITERRHPVLGNPVTCTEPSPDVAKALSTLAQMGLSGGNGAANGSLSLSGGSAEAFAELAGRSTALLALRDGLFRACEAYANGIIGANAYALILSRYGQLMTTLFLGQDVAGVAVAAGKGTLTSPTLNSPSSNAEQSNSQKPAASSTSDSAPASGGTQTSSGASSQTSTQTTSSAVSTDPAAALTRMNEDYFALEYDLVHLLVVACINENDPTRLRRAVDPITGVQAANQNPEANSNSWLQDICVDLKTSNMPITNGIAKMEGDAFVNIMKYFQPVNPVSTTKQANKAAQVTQVDTKKNVLAGPPWTVTFASKSTPSAAGLQAINAAAKGVLAAVKANPATKVSVTGYADASGTSEQNHTVALARANYVVKQLEAHGVGEGNILTVEDGSATSTKAKEAIIDVSPKPAVAPVTPKTMP